ncbi:carbohydrate ABC transporter permease [Rubrobacter xylanophilus]|uniref:carbohydrate ABC transporter permease n=1 Tax=Rubrobacter xylanophilus TaxID=49319 RepID=UPI001F3E7D35|nr:sugar ABC transporter permease [Rubrobacter xylanophilus]
MASGRRKWGGWRPVHALFLLPAFLLYTLFVVYPMVSALRFSLYEWNGLERVAFSGLENFRTLFTRYPYDEEVWDALRHNLYLFAVTMVVQNAFALFLAVVLDRGIRRGRTLFRNIFFLPHLIAVVVVGFLWSLILNPQFGVFNRFLEAVGLGVLAHPWLGDPDTALTAVALVNAWSWVGFPLIIFLANLAGIPEEYHEAARLDGAGGWQVFRYVTLPLLAPSITIVTVLTFIGNFNAFDLIYAMGGSNGSPGGSTDVLALLFYRIAFAGNDPNAVGVSNALAVLMFVVVFAVSVVYLRWRGRGEVTY